MTLDEQKTLTERLDMASRQYYRGEESEFSNADFDMMLHELQNAERENNYAYPFSPSLRVGSDLLDHFEKGEHKKPMLTINNTYDDDGLRKWAYDILRQYPTATFNVGIKYDGVSLELTYIDGILTKALTRGDKIIGDDVTNNAKTIKSIPLKIDRANKGEFYVRGEVLLPRTELYYVNEEREKNGEPKLSNTRNACSGSIKQLDSRICAQRHLTFRAWDCCFFDEREKQWGPSMTTKFSFLNALGFQYEKETMPFAVYGDVEELIRRVNTFKAMLNVRSDINFDYDGIVIKVDNLKLQEEIGTSDLRSIDWAIARKSNEEYATTTKIEGVEFSVGRTGNITPVAKLKPVELDGVIISNVTLNNEDYINAFNLHIGDEVDIVRSGGVIPQIVGNATQREDGNRERGEKIVFPAVCPDCGEPLKKSGANHFCTNENCPSRLIRGIEFWCSKAGMDIKGFGMSVIEDLHRSDYKVVDVMDLYRVFERNTVDEIVRVLGEGYGIKTVEKLKTALEDSKNRKLETIITALGIDGVGKVMARSLVDVYESFENLMNASIDDLMRMDGIGITVAKNIYKWMQKNGQNWLTFLKDDGFYIEKEKVSENGGKQAYSGSNSLVGFTVLFTGKSKYFTGDDVEKFLEANGATIASSVSKKLSVLITGDKPGLSKVQKANTLGITIFNEDDFYTKFNLKPNGD